MELINDCNWKPENGIGNKPTLDTIISQETKDYLKCVYANKVTLAGYALIGTGIGIGLIENYHNINPNTAFSNMIIAQIINLGIGCLGITKIGLETLNVYNRTKKHIEKYHTINDEFQGKYNPWHCTRAGVRLAAKEKGLPDPYK